MQFVGPVPVACPAVHASHDLDLVQLPPAECEHAAEDRQDLDDDDGQVLAQGEQRFDQRSAETRVCLALCQSKMT